MMTEQKTGTKIEEIRVRLKKEEAKLRELEAEMESLKKDMSRNVTAIQLTEETLSLLHYNYDYVNHISPDDHGKIHDFTDYNHGLIDNVVYAAALLCRKELEYCVSVTGDRSYDFFIKHVFLKQPDSFFYICLFLLYAHFGNNMPVDKLVRKLEGMAEEEDYVLEHIPETGLEIDIPDYCRPLRPDEWKNIERSVNEMLEFINLNNDKRYFYSRLIRRIEIRYGL